MCPTMPHLPLPEHGLPISNFVHKLILDNLKWKREGRYLIYKQKTVFISLTQLFYVPQQNLIFMQVLLTFANLLTSCSLNGILSSMTLFFVTSKSRTLLIFLILYKIFFWYSMYIIITFATNICFYLSIFISSISIIQLHWIVQSSVKQQWCKQLLLLLIILVHVLMLKHSYTLELTLLCLCIVLVNCYLF